MFKRFSLFMLVNVLVLVTVSFTLNLLGVNRYLYSRPASVFMRTREKFLMHRQLFNRSRFHLAKAVL
jgi:hypothetical protein